MTPVRPSAVAVVCLALLGASGAARAARGEPAPEPRAGRVVANGNAYVRDVETRMRTARSRIVDALQRRQLRAGAMQQMLGDVDVGIGAIRKRVAGYAMDGAITDVEDGDVKALASAIATDLANHHGPIAPWYLLP